MKPLEFPLDGTDEGPFLDIIIPRSRVLDIVQTYVREDFRSAFLNEMKDSMFFMKGEKLSFLLESGGSFCQIIQDDEHDYDAFKIDYIESEYKEKGTGIGTALLKIMEEISRAMDVPYLLGEVVESKGFWKEKYDGVEFIDDDDEYFKISLEGRE